MAIRNALKQIDDKQIALLDKEWSKEEGFLGFLREGDFDEVKRDKFLNLVRSIKEIPLEPNTRRLIALLWFTPIFLEWQKQQFDNQEIVDKVDHVENEILTELYRLLGVP